MASSKTKKRKPPPSSTLLNQMEKQRNETPENPLFSFSYLFFTLNLPTPLLYSLWLYIADSEVPHS